MNTSSDSNHTSSFAWAGTYPSHSAAETEEWGRRLASEFLATPSLPHFVALYGDLGVGKTAFVRGFSSVLAPDARVKSPTFALVNEYRGKPLSVFHFDMYRITDEDELYAIGFDDYLDRAGVSLVEWSENIEFALPDAYLRVEIVKDCPDSPDSRTITITPIGI